MNSSPLNLMPRQDHPEPQAVSPVPIDGGASISEATDYLEMVRKLKLDLAEKSNECELLKIRVDETHNEVESLSRELNECKLAIFETSEDSRKNQEEVVKSKKLEEDYVKLMSDFLDLGERSDQYKLNLVDSYLTKSNAINSLECFMSSGVISKELEECRANLGDREVEVNLIQAKLRNLEEENLVKEKSITELKKALDDAKVTHNHEINVLEEYISCLKNTITSYEKTLASYIEPTSKSLEGLAHE